MMVSVKAFGYVVLLLTGMKPRGNGSFNEVGQNISFSVAALMLQSTSENFRPFWPKWPPRYPLVIQPQRVPSLMPPLLTPQRQNFQF
jgi:hypothetical protein